MANIDIIRAEIGCPSRSDFSFMIFARRRNGPCAASLDAWQKAAEFDELARSASEPALKNAVLTSLSAIAFWRASENGSLKQARSSRTGPMSS